MSEIKLLRCPFCGGEAELLKGQCEIDNYVMCLECRSKTKLYNTKASAIKAWNTRKPMQNIVERLEEENTLLKEQRTEAIEYDDEQIIFAANNQIRAFDYSLRVIKEEGGMNV